MIIRSPLFSRVTSYASRPSLTGKANPPRSGGLLLFSRGTRHAARSPFALAFLAVGVLAHAQPSLVDQLFERHVRVKATVGGGVLHLLYQRKADPQAPPTSCYRRYAPGQGWLGEETLGGAHGCAAFLDGTLYVFRDDNYSLYRTGDWKARYIFHQEDDAGAGEESTWETRPWPLPWAPESACRVAGEIWAFGVAAAGASPQIVAARLVAASTENPSPAPAALGKPLSIRAKASDVHALALGPSATVFWHHDPADGLTNELWQAAFDGEAWTLPVRMAQPYPRSDYTAAEHEGRVWLFFKKRGERIKTTQPLMAAAGAGHEWDEPAAVPEALDPRLNWTLDIDAASFDGTLYVFRACMNRVVAHRWAHGKWLAPETLIQLSPWPTYVFWWLLLNVVASLILLPVVALVAVRVRGRPRPMAQAFGSRVGMASWARRVAAQLVDFLVTMLLCSVAVQWLGLLDGDSAETEAFLGTLGLYSAIYFAYFVIGETTRGQSLGKWVLRIGVVGCDGRRASLLRIAVRNLLRPWPFLVPTAYLVGSLSLLLTRTSQRLGDLLARTYVVDIPPEAPSAERTGDE